LKQILINSIIIRGNRGRQPQAGKTQEERAVNDWILNAKL